MGTKGTKTGAARRTRKPGPGRRAARTGADREAVLSRWEHGLQERELAFRAREIRLDEREAKIRAEDEKLKVAAANPPADIPAEQSKEARRIDLLRKLFGTCEDARSYAFAIAATCRRSMGLPVREIPGIGCLLDALICVIETIQVDGQGVPDMVDTNTKILSAALLTKGMLHLVDIGGFDDDSALIVFECAAEVIERYLAEARDEYDAATISRPHNHAA